MSLTEVIQELNHVSTNFLSQAGFMIIQLSLNLETEQTGPCKRAETCYSQSESLQVFFLWNLLFSVDVLRTHRI